MSYQTIVRKDSRAVVINDDLEGYVFANLYVNCTETDLGDITLMRWTGRTTKGAIKWADKQLAA